MTYFITVLIFILKLISFLIFIIFLLLLLIGISLFIPVKYKVYGNYSLNDNYKFNITIEWLLKIFYLKYEKSNKNQFLKIKILGIDLNNSNKKKLAKDIANEFVKPELDEIEVNKPKEENKKIETNINFDNKFKKKKKKSNIRKKILELKNIYIKITSSWEYIKSIKLEIITFIKNVIKKVKPKKFEIYGDFGFISPDETGKVFGMICVFKSMSGCNIKLKPDFNNRLCNLNIDVEGNMNTGVISIQVLKFIFSKNVLSLIKNVGLSKNKL